MASSLPWEEPLCNLAISLTGDTAYSIALVGLFISGGMLLFGGDLSHFAKRIVVFVFAVSIMIAASPLFSIFQSRTNNFNPSSPAPSSQATTLSANTQVNTYTLINQSLGKQAIETSSCYSSSPPIQQKFDNQLNKDAFIIKASQSCNDDKHQIIEIGSNDDSTDNLKGFQNDTAVYRWKFKLNKNFTPSSSFSHIHQIKAEGLEQYSPVIIFMPNSSSSGSEKLLVIYYPPSKPESQKQVLAYVNLDALKGKWITAYEKIHYGKNGSYFLELKELNTNQVVLSYNQDIDTWIDNTLYMRPQWGLSQQITSSRKKI